MRMPSATTALLILACALALVAVTLGVVLVDRCP